MGRIISSYIFPHPPLIIPEVGKGQESEALDTINACKKAAKDIKNDKPSTIIITTPHGPFFDDYIYIPTDDTLKGNMGRFGRNDVSFQFENATCLLGKIISRARDEGIYSGGLDESIMEQYRISGELDHGALVPLYYVTKEYTDFKLINISVANLPLTELYRFGMCIFDAVKSSDENVVLLASGDLSHKLSHEGPYGFNPRGREFDDLFVSSVINLDVEKLLDADEGLCESAAECGLRSFVIMFGALDRYELKSDVYSYEGPFGIGYSVARFAVGNEKETGNILKNVEDKKHLKLKLARDAEDPYVSLARMTLETYIKDKKVIKVPENIPTELLEERAGTFVSIKKDGQLRGCIGTISPTKENVAEEIIQNAISSGTRDPRFDPVDEDELDSLVYSVDVLKDSEPINSIEELDVEKYGVIVRHGMRSGLLLPNLEGIDTPEEQVSIALRKAGINPNSNYNMERFEVIRHK